MMAPDPLRSAMAGGSAEDTSLALPSDDKLRTGQQRVLDQVYTIKRSKSKHGKSGSPTVSPTNLNLQTSTSSTEFGAFRFFPSKVNGTFRSTSSTLPTGYSKAINTQRSRSLYTNSKVGRHVSTSGTVEQQVSASKWPQSPNGLKLSRSDPILAAQVSPAPGTLMRAKGQTAQTQQTHQRQVNRSSIHSVTNGAQMTSSQTRIVQPSSVWSHTDGKMGTMKISKADMQQSAANSAVNASDMTLEQAVDFLSHCDESYQQHGANFIQRLTFSKDDAKQKVHALGGIPVLVTLLRSRNPEVNNAAAGALRNLVFKDKTNKLVVENCGGIAKALQLLKETKSTETEKQITGLLWNLSSEDSLKKELTVTAMPVLTDHVLMPHTSWSETTMRDVHPEVLLNVTGCLRNLSHGKKKERQAMRTCPHLVDSVVLYVQTCVTEGNVDDKSLENCACILHNLTFELETEHPQCFQDVYSVSGDQPGKKSPTIGCFSPRSSKIQKEFDFNSTKATPVDPAASGVAWLCHPKAMETYLSLLDTSQNDSTLEACCGALQNLTASRGQGASAASHVLVQKLAGAQTMSGLLKSSNQNLKKSGISLLSNVSRISALQPLIAKQVLPDLCTLLSSGSKEMGFCDSTIASACSTAQNLIFSDTEISKKAFNSDLLYSLSDIRANGDLPIASKVATVLLYNMWNDKNLRAVLKKMAMHKAFFVKDNLEQLESLSQVGSKQ